MKYSLILFLVGAGLLVADAFRQRAHERHRQAHAVLRETVARIELEANNALVTHLAHEVFRSDRLDTRDWTSVSLVFDLANGPVSNGGFAYCDDDVVPTRVSGPGVDECVRLLRDDVARLGRGAPVQILVQLHRDGQFKIDFEFEDPSRWRVGSAELDRMREALRPRFASWET